MGTVLVLPVAPTIQVPWWRIYHLCKGSAPVLECAEIAACYALLQEQSTRVLAKE